MTDPLRHLAYGAANWRLFRERARLELGDPGLEGRSREIVSQFQTLFYESCYVGRESCRYPAWMGVEILKNPFDLWTYQEILFEIRPELVIETGTAFGGSALFLATMLEVLGTGEVLSIDIAQKPSRPTHRRLFYRIGSSTSPEILKEAGERARAVSRVVVILDSDHRKSHVLEELNRYAPLVTPGSYLIVEDTHINGNPVFKDFGPGPREAVLEFLPFHPEFEPDHSKERFLMTFNPGGFLKRRSP